MMTMDGRDSAECQNWEKKDIVGINGKVLMTLKTKVNSAISYIEKGKRKRGEKGDARSHFQTFRERGSSFSLSFYAIRPSSVFETRRKAALREEGFAWVPDLGNFLKLREVGFSPYLGFILCLRAMLMFELNEAVRGRLIGPKSWDRIVVIFGAIFTVHGLCAWNVWAVCVMIYALNHVVMCMRSGSAEKYEFT